MIYHLQVFQKAKSSRCKKIFALLALILHCSFELTTLKAAAIEIYRPQLKYSKDPNPVFNQSHQVIQKDSVDPNLEISSLTFYQSADKFPSSEIKNSLFKSFVFDEAKITCFKNNQDYSLLIQRLLQTENNSILNNLINTYGRSIENKFSDVQILIDNFSSFQKNDFKRNQSASAADSLGFRSFFIPAQKNIKNTISLDCQPNTIVVWPSLLSHELTHFLNQKLNLAYWMDELLAQVHEVEQSRLFPYPRLDSLKSETNPPSFFSDKSYFQKSGSSKVYAMNLLFGLYLTNLFKGGPILKFIHKDIQSVSDLSEKLKFYTQQIHQLDYYKNILSAKGLIRHFALAANINLPLSDGSSFFQIPNWNGFAKTALVTTDSAQLSYQIPPGGFLRLARPMITDDEFVNFKNSTMEIYRIQKNQNYFQILTPQNQPGIENTSSTTWDEDFYLLINTSETETFTFTI